MMHKAHLPRGNSTPFIHILSPLLFIATTACGVGNSANVNRNIFICQYCDYHFNTDPKIQLDFEMH